MVYIFKGKNYNEIYEKQIKTIKEEGKKYSPRGMDTLELYPAITIIENPRQRFLSCYGRKINPFFLCAEILWIMSGRGDKEWIKTYCGDLIKYSDELFPDFNGSYGVRLRRWGQDRARNVLRNKILGNSLPFDQIEDVIDKLRADQDTRQAVMTLHNPWFDRCEIKTNDRPCNIVSMFKIRDNKLCLHQVLRSNDVVLGLPTNVFQWSFIQELIAAELKIDVGELIFISDSLHMYSNDKIAEKVLSGKGCVDIYKNLDLNKIQTDLFDSDYEIRRIMEEYLSIKDVWFDLSLMLYMYRLRLQGRKMEAIYETKNLQQEDFKIMAYNYHWNKAKTEEEKNLIKLCVSIYSDEIKNFIMED